MPNEYGKTDSLEVRHEIDGRAVARQLLEAHENLKEGIKLLEPDP